MYKNKILGSSSPGVALPLFGEEAKEGFAGLGGNCLCLPLSLPAHCSPFLPSGDSTEETWKKTTAEALVLFLQLTKRPSTPADCVSLTPNSTQHPRGAAACLAGCPRCRSQFLPPTPQDTK